MKFDSVSNRKLLLLLLLLLLLFVQFGNGGLGDCLVRQSPEALSNSPLVLDLVLVHPFELVEDRCLLR